MSFKNRLLAKWETGGFGAVWGRARPDIAASSGVIRGERCRRYPIAGALNDL